MDKFEEIFSMQDALNRRIGVNLPWKWWAKNQKYDEQNAKVEVVDLFHFLVSLAQTLGMTADDVYQAYLKKNAVNHQRQESGYIKKDELDSKHI